MPSYFSRTDIPDVRPETETGTHRAWDEKRARQARVRSKTPLATTLRMWVSLHQRGAKRTNKNYRGESTEDTKHHLRKSTRP